MALEDIINAVSDALGSNALLVSGKQQEKATQYRDSAARQEAVIPDRISNAETAARGTMNAQDAGIAVRNQLQNNPNDPDSLLALLTQDFVQSTKEARGQRDQIIQKKQVGLLDNPLEFLWNQITLPDEINAMKATESKASMAAQKIAEMQNLTTAAAQAQMATKKTITDQMIAAQSRIDIADAQDRISKLNVEALGSDIAAVDALNSANQSQINARIQLLSAQNMAFHQVIAANQENREAARNDIFIREKEQDEKAENEIARKISIGAAIAGRPDLTFEEVKMRRRQKIMPEALAQELMRRGEHAEATAVLNPNRIPSPAVGLSPGDSILSVGITGGLDGAQYRPVKDYLDKLKAEAMQQPQVLAAKTIPEARALVTKYVDDKLFGVDAKGKPNPALGDFTKLLRNVETDGNIFKAGELQTYLDLPAVKANPLYKSVIAPAAAAGVKSANFSTLLAQAKVAGESPERIAEGLSQFYQSVTTAKQSVLSKFAIPYYPTYNVVVDNRYGNPFSTDHVNAARRESILDYLITSERTSKYLENLGTVVAPGGINQ